MATIFLTLHLFIGTTLSGSALIVALVLGYDSAAVLFAAAAIGFIAAFPVSYLIALRLRA
ncbi:MAG: CTP synthetase [Aestuariivita sp.]|uniref:CTP synthetase n=1 Tax=Aestuariivita sp. TaxID=1872407 RepID=UPI003BAF9184